MKKLLLATAFTIGLTAQAFAGNLDTYKSQGLVGETTMGLVAPVAAASPEVAAFVDELNAKRLEKYKSVAAQNGITLEQTQKLAGKKLVGETPSGQWVQNSSGEWVKK